MTTTAPNLSAKRLRLLRAALWDANTDQRDRYLAVIAEGIEISIASGLRRAGIANRLRYGGFGHSEIGLLRDWALRHGHLELDEVLNVISAEIRS